MDDDDFVIGSVVRLKLKNFMTFEALEFRPEPHLNVIIGPNGTGKSTIFCAIGLALGAKSNTLGRASNVGDFVKYKCAKATIELELYHRPHNFIITRVIEQKTNKSEWRINGKLCSQKAVEELAQSLNIHMNNLCQFLPQERVADFARMSQQELLENTEMATGETELLEFHQKLKAATVHTRKQETELGNLGERLEQEKQKNMRLETDVNNLREREVFLEKIKMLKMKRPWVEYQEKKAQYAEAKTRLETIKEATNEARRKFAPLEQKLTEMDKKKTELDLRIKDQFAVIKENAQSIKKFSEDIEERSDRCADQLSDLKAKEEEEEKRKKRLSDLKRQIAAMETELQQLDKNENLEPHIERNNQEICLCNRKITEVQQKASSTSREIEELRRQSRDLQEELNRIFDIEKRRLEILKQRHKSTYDAVIWLRENKQMFRRPVYEPMILCLHMKNVEDAKIIENHVSFNDLRAFVFEDREDMNQFLAIVRDEKHLRVNTVIIPPQGLDHFQPRVSIESLGRYHFQKYLLELIDCPDGVKRYLCSQYNLHTVPLGTQETKDLAPRIISENPTLRMFYTPDTQYSVKKSQYDGEMTTRNAHLKMPTILAASADSEKANQLRQSLQVLTRSCHAKEQILQGERVEIQHLEEEMNRLREEKKALLKKKNQESALRVQIKNKMEGVAQLEKSAIDLEAERSRCLQNLHNTALEKADLLFKQCDRTERCCGLMTEKIRLCLEQSVVVRNFTILKSSIQEEQRKVSEAEVRYEEAKNHLNEIKDQAKRLLEVAKKTTGLAGNEKLPTCVRQNPADGDAVSLIREFDLYPNSLAEIDAEIRDLTIRADCTSQADRGILQEYEDRKRNIERLEEQLARSQLSATEHLEKIAETKRLWLTKIKDLLDRINRNFSFFFRTMKCAGEVDLNVPDNPEDYEKYGIRIRVKYRDSEPLRELTAHHQSGGERSVATVLYMLSLQELARCPLRMVDEINQGMDPINERKVFELMTETICRKTTSQYFMLTPKLLSDLTYADNLNVACVINGVGVMMECWNVRKFIKKRRRMQVAAEREEEG